MENSKKSINLLKVYLLIAANFAVIMLVFFFVLLLKDALYIFKSTPMLILIGAFVLLTIAFGLMLVLKHKTKEKQQSVVTMKIKQNSKDVKKFFSNVKLPKTKLSAGIRKILSIRFKKSVNSGAIKLKTEEEKINARIELLKKEAQLRSLEEKKKKADEQKTQKEQRKKTRIFNKMFKSLKKKFPHIPSEKLKRKALERSIASTIQGKDDAFTVSGIMESLASLYSREIDNGMRNELLDEIKEWIAEDESIKTVESNQGINHYAITS